MRSRRAWEASRMLARRSSRRERRPSRIRSRTWASVREKKANRTSKSSSSQASGALARPGRRLGGLVDPARVEQLAQRRVERAVGQGAEDAERGGEALAQLVAVQGTVVEKAEDRELEQRGAAALRTWGGR